MKKRVLWLTIILISLPILGLLAQETYWNVVGRWHGEAFYARRPTTYWRERIQANEVRKAEESRRFFGIGRGALPTTWREHLQVWRETWLGNDDLRLAELNADADALPVWRDLLRDGNLQVRVSAYFVVLKHGQDLDLPTLIDFVMNEHELLHLEITGGAKVAAIAIHQRFGNQSGKFYYAWLRHNDADRVKIACSGVALCGETSAPAIPLFLSKLDTAEGAMRRKH